MECYPPAPGETLDGGEGEYGGAKECLAGLGGKAAPGYQIVSFIIR